MGKLSSSGNAFNRAAGLLLRYLRESNGESLITLSGAVNYSVTYLSHQESGRQKNLNIQIVLVYCDRYGMSSSRFFETLEKIKEGLSRIDSILKEIPKAG